MQIRTTFPLMFARANSSIQRHTARIGAAQEQLTTGLRVNRPSDDPLASRSILNYQALETQLDARLKNITDARAKLDSSVSQILAAKEVLLKAKDIALESPQDFEFEALANQVAGMRERLLQIANSQVGSQYLFGGTDLTDRPFAAQTTTEFGEVQYQGADDRYTFSLEQAVSVDLYLTGREIFQPRDRGTTVYVGNSGATAGTGTDTAVGRGQLVIRHVSTTYAGASGIQAGSGSVAGDTILGPSGTHSLVIQDTSGTGASGTISLNGGDPIAFTNGDTNLRITGPAGAVVYVDTTSITAGFNGTVSITANGSLSVDGGATTTPLSFSVNQAVTHGATGAITYVNTTAVRAVGEEHLEYSGTVDAFSVLEALEDDLRNTRQLSGVERQAATSRTIGDLDRIIDHLINVAGEQSSTLENIDALETRYEDLRLETKRQKGELESADVSDLVIQLQTEQNLLQFAYSTTAGLFDLNILNFL